MKALVDYTIRSNIRNVTDLTITIEAVAIPDIVTTFRINADQLSTRRVLKVCLAYTIPVVFLPEKGITYFYSLKKFSFVLHEIG